MVRKIIRACMFAAMGAVAVALAYGSAATAGQKDDKLPDISEIMKKGHAKTDGYIAKIRGAAKGQMWDDAQKYAKDFAILGLALGKNKPPKGDDKSWKALTDKYMNSTKTVAEGAEKKDAKLVNKGLAAINCKECHDKHR